MPVHSLPSPSVASAPAHSISTRPARADDILKTLSENEKSVVKFLLENNAFGTQARIKNSIGMPKTSLSRILRMLERKRVVEIERIGKLKKVKLTSWFMENE